MLKERLDQRLEVLGRTKKWLIAKLDMNSSTFWRKVAGETEFTYLEMINLASALETTPEFLLKTEEKSQKNQASESVKHESFNPDSDTVIFEQENDGVKTKVLFKKDTPIDMIREIINEARKTIDAPEQIGANTDVVVPVIDSKNDDLVDVNWEKLPFYDFTDAIINKVAFERRPGNILLFHKDSSSIFLGRADEDLFSKLKYLQYENFSGKRMQDFFLKFKFCYARDDKIAYRRECNDYHRFESSLINDAHPKHDFFKACPNKGCKFYNRDTLLGEDMFENSLRK